ncbi:ubiquitin carrier protein [Thecamonas trahens ATCC 50062]|uniref:Ubiquitin carrier protein n=1 Tax=Thecamonas trahens ATCC 50062 TaxID=461836 RepID=A0A0L0D8L6_THETB|nr:ubiquitin carrier protein [Thecamonas trahens ATCC 50062]KNC48426.1 ubiquitin carrier protein [Thecamonas trahens ATCC 50062]|eukprot:XP_013758541.1 ubiquitin carrier protein [Thecamonas trahens ATCC 50062]
MPGVGAMKRLLREYKELSRSPPDGIAAAPVSDSNVFQWKVAMVGPEGSDYEGAFLTAVLDFPHNYPLAPPTMTFTTPVWHPNVYPSGKVCISILHEGTDASGYESATERWSPIQSVLSIVLSVLSMLADPNDESPANVDAAVEWRDNRPAFRARVKAHIEASLGLSPELLRRYPASIAASASSTSSLL